MRAAQPRRLSNVVFMGMGEPMANYDRMWEAVTRFQGDMGLSARHLTLSTVGIVPGIRRLATENLPVNLAVSLHAANDEKRDELVPINKRYPLAMLAEACAEYVAATRRRLSIEWAMIHDVNDQGRDAAELAEFARPLGAHINLIPLNPTPGYAVVGSTMDRVRRLPRPTRGPGDQRHRAPDPGRRDRRRLRSAGRFGHLGTAPHLVTTNYLRFTPFGTRMPSSVACRIGSRYAGSPLMRAMATSMSRICSRVRSPRISPDALSRRQQWLGRRQHPGPALAEHRVGTVHVGQQQRRDVTLAIGEAEKTM